VVNATSRPLYPPDTNHTRGWVGPRAGLDGYGEEEISCSHACDPDRPAHRKLLYRLRYAGCHLRACGNPKFRKYTCLEARAKSKIISEEIALCHFYLYHRARRICVPRSVIYYASPHPVFPLFLDENVISVGVERGDEIGKRLV
jgi:hypothetical protein